ncbi:carboxymuconolactone decarboxylase family protein [Rhodococcus sp. HM1]|uniref:carboxymuconolactone decarboxylase family protein n=1 Tax=unclassified Rhodococcus (in: high G+C Gram-positive bacteria) TaxID=192944 RepID=UPI0018CC7E4A|nr:MULTISPECIES: carboxymuconolactone decarboxylase family protein [unclassified Rhodococcus (in: high G+C Gram-positive bacteria)]MBH0118059.1 carboxymuconolactone decarboxylase family protein [Rhodococcus sp. CX]MCK8672932.1 carboxymuconolactone decarboxylase family protein [Rhodococcus sp. HM1]
MARIPVVTPDQAGPATKVAYKMAARMFGEVPEPFTVLAHHPGLMRSNAVHEMLAQRASKVLPKNVREIAVYRTAWNVGCSWCVDFGTMLQRLDGLDTERLEHIADYKTSDLYSDDERAAIEYADAMTGNVREDVTDEQVADLERRFGQAGLVELTYNIALENMRARMNSALGIHDQGFSTDACRVPWADQSAVQGSTSSPTGPGFQATSQRKPSGSEK